MPISTCNIHKQTSIQAAYVAHARTTEMSRIQAEDKENVLSQQRFAFSNMHLGEACPNFLWMACWSEHLTQKNANTSSFQVSVALISQPGTSHAHCAVCKTFVSSSDAPTLARPERNFWKILLSLVNSEAPKSCKAVQETITMIFIKSYWTFIATANDFSDIVLNSCFSKHAEWFNLNNWLLRFCFLI